MKPYKRSKPFNPSEHLANPQNSIKSHFKMIGVCYRNRDVFWGVQRVLNSSLPSNTSNLSNPQYISRLDSSATKYLSFVKPTCIAGKLYFLEVSEGLDCLMVLPKDICTEDNQPFGSRPEVLRAIAF